MHHDSSFPAVHVAVAGTIARSNPYVVGSHAIIGALVLGLLFFPAGCAGAPDSSGATGTSDLGVLVAFDTQPNPGTDSLSTQDMSVGPATACGDGVCAVGEGVDVCPEDCGPVCGDGVCSTSESAGTCSVDCGTVCGDEVCASGENYDNCPGDCEASCGDALCEDSETSLTCVVDCGTVCGDGACHVGEGSTTCPDDCGSVCGDGACNGSESSQGCASDCGETCGDGACNGGESSMGCPSDCGSVCGDGACNGSESTQSCSDDCGTACGDGACNGGESSQSCADDCGAVCGDGVCNGAESSQGCPGDCGSAPSGDTGIFDPQREAWRAEGQVSVQGNRFMVGGEPYYPKTDFLTAVFPGNDWSSWSSLFYFAFDAGKRQTIRDALVESEYNSIYVFTLNIGDGVVTPYGQGGFSADTNALNQGRVNDWKAAVEDLLAHQLKPFIWLAGDDSPAVAAMPLSAWQAYVDDMVEAFEPYPILWVIGLEVDEYWTPAQVEERRAYLASKTDHPVGVHLTISESTNVATPYQSGFDYVMGQLHSPQSNAAYIDQTAAYTIQSVPWVASEFNVYGVGDGGEAVGSVTERSGDIGAIIASVGDPPLVAGIGNGIDLGGAPPQPVPAPQGEGPPADLSGVIWLHTDVSGWPQTATLSSVSIQGGQICMPYDKANEWPIAIIQGSSGDVEIVGNPWVFIKHEGQWYAATWEWLRPGQTCKAKTSVAGDHIKQPPFGPMNWTPTPGQTYGFMISAPARMGQMTVAERSNVVTMVWPGTGGNSNSGGGGGGGGGDPQPTGQADPGQQLTGTIDSATKSGSGALVNGWACHLGWSGSIDVHVYVGGPAGVGSLLSSGTANASSEPAVAAACQSAGTNHRFTISVSHDQLVAHQGQPIYVHGISPVGNDNLLIEGSGVHSVPSP